MNAGPPAPVESGEHTEPFGVLMVCTANMCRSPMAEYMMRERLRQMLGSSADSHWHVSSAGTHVPAGASIHPTAIQVLQERGIDVEGVPARQATAAILERADLVLTADRAQRAWVAECDPTAIRRVFTMRQFARLCAAAAAGTDRHGPAPAAELLALASLGRTLTQPASAELDSIADPMGQGLAEFRESGDLIDRCIQQTLLALGD